MDSFVFHLCCQLLKCHAVHWLLLLVKLVKYLFCLFVILTAVAGKIKMIKIIHIYSKRFVKILCAVVY